MVDQIGTGNSADELIGDDRPPSRRSSALLVVLVLALGGYAVTRLLDPQEPPQRAPADASPTATAAPAPPAALSSAIPSPYTSAYPASAEPTPTPAPWAGLARRRDLGVDFALHRLVRAAGRSYRLGRGDRALDMHDAAAGPVLLVQSRGSTVLEQLRRDGSRLVLETFQGDSRLPQGIAVDPAGRRVAYAVTSGTSRGPFGLVVQELRTGAVLASRTTRRPFGVRDWLPSGVVLTVAAESGGLPFRWRPGSGAPDQVTPAPGGGTRLFLLAGAPRREEWLVTGPRCAGLVRALGRRPARWYCQVPLAEPAAWSPSGQLVVARGDRPVLRVLDLRNGRTSRLGIPPRVFVSQVTWRSTDTVLVSLRTLSGGRGAVLSCRLEQPCRRLGLGAPGPAADLVLSL